MRMKTSRVVIFDSKWKFVATSFVCYLFIGFTLAIAPLNWAEQQAGFDRLPRPLFSDPLLADALALRWPHKRTSASHAWASVAEPEEWRYSRRLRRWYAHTQAAACATSCCSCALWTFLSRSFLAIYLSTLTRAEKRRVDGRRGDSNSNKWSPFGTTTTTAAAAANIMMRIKLHVRQTK